jgi:hypothetical protein
MADPFSALKNRLRGPPNLSALLCFATLCAIGIFVLIRQAYEPQRIEGDTPTAVTLARISHLSILCEEYRTKTGSWPVSISALTNLVALDSTNDLIDGWGRQLLLVPAANRAPAMLLISYGADGLPGGASTNGDISYLVR